MKTKSRAIIWTEEGLLLIRRKKDGTTYYVFPGGSVEEGETTEQACIRELYEEFGITIEIAHVAYEYTDYMQNVKEVFYICTWVSGEMGSGKDVKFMPGTLESEGYSIVYVQKSELGDMLVLPQSVRDSLVKSMQEDI